MKLAIQVAGALAAGGLAVLLARQAGLRGRQAAGAVAIVPVVVAAALAFPTLRDATNLLLDQRDADAALSSEQAQLQAGISVNVNVAFLGWAGSHFGEGESFYLVVKPSADTGGYVSQWGPFQLAPHLESESPSTADWLVFYDTSPARYRGADPSDLDVYSPGFAVVRNTP
jgi:hypothetical protein